jgi:hypothetical protein
MMDSNTRTSLIEKLAPHMVGKTITRIDERAVNCLEIEFSDGTELRLEVEAVNGPIGLYGISGYIRAEESH